MTRQPFHAATTPTRVLSCPRTSCRQRTTASTRNPGIRCQSGFVHGDCKSRAKSFTSTNGVVGGKSVLGRRTAGSVFVCNDGYYGNSADLYFDGASRGAYGPGGAGAYLLNDNGNCFWEGYKFFGKADNTIAEYQGLILGLVAAKDAGIDYVNVYGDSDTVIEQMLGTRNIQSDKIYSLYSKVYDLDECFSNVAYYTIDRQDNATSAMKNRRYWWQWYD